MQRFFLEGGMVERVGWWRWLFRVGWRKWLFVCRVGWWRWLSG